MDPCAVEQEAVCAVLLASNQGPAEEGLCPLPPFSFCLSFELFLFLSCFQTQTIFVVFRDIIL